MHYHQIPIFYRRPLGVHWGVHWASIGRPLSVQYRCPQVLYPGPWAHGPKNPRKKLWGPWAHGENSKGVLPLSAACGEQGGPGKEGPRKGRACKRKTPQRERPRKGRAQNKKGLQKEKHAKGKAQRKGVDNAHASATCL